MISRVAYLSLHTSPLLQPGLGDAGGMNVYIHELAQTMADRGVAVDVFTRRDDPSVPAEVLVSPNYRVIHVDAGPARRLPIAALPEVVGTFAKQVITWIRDHGLTYDLVHSHYWISGWAGVMVKQNLQIPLANSFHTLGRIKDLTRRPDQEPSSAVRVLTEQEVIDQSDCVIASTPAEATDLLEHYGASPERQCVSPPGVDHELFSPGSKVGARDVLGLGDGNVLLYAGRIQALKGIDVAIEATARLRDVDLLIVGGPSGPRGSDEVAGLRSFAEALDVADRVHFLSPQPHERLADFYRAADLLVLPSRSESFGLVAAEAQACGLPVLAANVGGLPHVVADGIGGVLVDGWDPATWASMARALLDDGDELARLSKGAAEWSARFSWPATANRLLELYAGITGTDAGS
ncbi:MAG: glycosyltransferase [Acidimicrobiia bacterium]|nr:glycosyltransferase [Acidimicrobiia bacterium]